jgi:peptide/nickel transport system substrate-binding protein
MLGLKRISLLLAAVSMLLTTGCGDGECPAILSTDATRVKHHSLSDPQSLNPYNGQGETSTYISYQVHQSLYYTNFKTYKLEPVLATADPVFTERSDGFFDMFMEIRPEAVWDDGTPITGHDVAFSLKVMKTPKVDNQQNKPYFEYIKAIAVDEENPKQFSLRIEPYMIAHGALTQLYILPRSVYDPNGLLDNYTVEQIEADKEALKDDPVLDEYAAFFNDVPFKREITAGSGPYTFDRWETNQRVVFKLKEDWWGHELSEVNHFYEAFPKEIVYEVIKDLTTGVVALKGEKIDAMRGINPKDFVEDLSKNECFTDRYNMHNPPLFSFDYIGLNMTRPIFAEQKTRLGLAYLMNVDQLIKSFCFGLGEPVTSIIHPSLTSRLNTDLETIPFDLEKAKQLLAEAGWEDSNADGILDRVIDGKRQDFRFTIITNNGNDRRRTACLIFQEGCRRAGVKVDVEIQEWANLLDNTKLHNFDAYIGGWISSPNESDPKQIWHTESFNGGSNYVGFGDENSDALIEELRAELDPDRRNQLWKDLQAAIRKDMPYIFLLSQKERIAIHKKFDNAYATGIRPGYWKNGFKPAESAL